jgi:hypothetical protein
MSYSLLSLLADSLEPSDERALLLTLNTQIIIAPKLRQNASAVRHDLNEESSVSTSSPFPESLRRQLFRMLPVDFIDPFGLSPTSSKNNDLLPALVHPVLYASIIEAVPSCKICLTWVAQPQSHHSGDNKDRDREKERKDRHKQKEQDDESDRRVAFRLERDRQIPQGHVWIPEKGKSRLGLKEGKEWELVR